MLTPPNQQRLTCAGKYYQWLAYGEVDKKLFEHREFSFTLKDGVSRGHTAMRETHRAHATVIWPLQPPICSS